MGAVKLLKIFIIAALALCFTSSAFGSTVVLNSTDSKSPVQSQFAPVTTVELVPGDSNDNSDNDVVVEEEVIYVTETDGDTGTITVDPDSESETIVEEDETHVITVIHEEDGSHGTEQTGEIIVIDGEEVPVETDGNEVIVVVDGDYDYTSGNNPGGTAVVVDDYYDPTTSPPPVTEVIIIVHETTMAPPPIVTEIIVVVPQTSTTTPYPYETLPTFTHGTTSTAYTFPPIATRAPFTVPTPTAPPVLPYTMPPTAPPAIPYTVPPTAPPVIPYTMPPTAPPVIPYTMPPTAPPAVPYTMPPTAATPKPNTSEGCGCTVIINNNNYNYYGGGPPGDNTGVVTGSSGDQTVIRRPVRTARGGPNVVRRRGQKQRMNLNGPGTRRRYRSRRLIQKNMGTASGVGNVQVYRVLRTRAGAKPVVVRNLRKRPQAVFKPKPAARRNDTLVWTKVPAWQAKRMQKLGMDVKVGRLEKRIFKKNKNKKVQLRSVLPPNKKLRYTSANQVQIQEAKSFDLKPLNLGLQRRLAKRVVRKDVKPHFVQKKKS